MAKNKKAEVEVVAGIEATVAQTPAVDAVVVAQQLATPPVAAQPGPSLPAGFVLLAPARQTGTGAAKYTWEGYSAAALCRYVGYYGGTAKNASAMLKGLGVEGVAPATVQTQVQQGRHLPAGKVLPLPPSLAARVLVAAGMARQES